MTDNTPWAEKYRPATIDDTILPESIKKQIKGLVEKGNLPSLLFTGSAGTGKTTLARAIANELGADLLFINASKEGGIDTIRVRLSQFASTVSFSGSKKITILDECLDESTLVHIIREGVKTMLPISELNSGTDLVRSLDIKSGKIEWVPFFLYDKGIREDCYEIEFENGEKVTATPEHKWFVENNDEIIVVSTDNLYKYNTIITERLPNEDNTTPARNPKQKCQK